MTFIDFSTYQIDSDVLPHKPSALLKIAIEDLRKCEQDPRYHIDMNEWYNYDGDKCHVCLAGAVMANRLKPSFIHVSTSPDHARIRALNMFRAGNIVTGLSYLNILCPSTIEQVYDIPRYHLDREGFYNSLAKLIQDFEENGL